VTEDIPAQPPADEVFRAADADARPRREEVEDACRLDDGRVVDVADVADRFGRLRLRLTVGDGDVREKGQERGE
jgi:hypothetical protein